MTPIYEAQASAEDQSVNFVAQLGPGQAFEARYVRRSEDYFIAYLSSHAGCDKACRFCHLTQTRQTSMVPATWDDYAQQAEIVLAYYADHATPAERVHFNFMARGEPLANPFIVGNYRSIAQMLVAKAQRYSLKPRLNISTIMPREIERLSLAQVLRDDLAGPPVTTLFYSLYSLDPEFRRRWLPKAMDPYLALDKLAEWQADVEGAEVVLHWTFIAGENDSEADVQAIIDNVNGRNLKARFNLVRYNSYSLGTGRESAEEVIQARFEQLKAGLGDDRSRIVPRVGFDVKASCGMFVETMAA